MKSCSWFKDVEALVDDEARNAVAVEAHVSACPLCAAHRDSLVAWRNAGEANARTLGGASFTVKHEF